MTFDERCELAEDEILEILDKYELTFEVAVSIEEGLEVMLVGRDEAPEGATIQ